MTGFARHRIDHVSASSLNLWAAEPALWVMERLLKRRTAVGPSAHLGTAVEAGVEYALLHPGESGLDAANRRFGELCADTDTAAKIDGMVSQALIQLAPYGKPDLPEDGRQHRVEVALDGVPVPCVGYTDFVFDSHGAVIDLKTGGALPAAIKAAHARQGAVYQKAYSNYSMRFCYVTQKKGAVYALENAADHLAALANIARRLERFLAVSSDPHELAGIVCPNYDAFYWSPPETRAAGLSTYGF